MNEIDELWSLPWHALQRKLAETYRAEASPGKPAALRRSPQQLDNTTPGSWLVRARSIAAHAAMAPR